MPDTPTSAAPKPSAALASALPQRIEGTRSRAGNAMARTRAALLEGALLAISQHGVRRTTMHDIAACAGIAKATLYNHFRAKENVLSALVEAQVHVVATECRALPLYDALIHAATRLSTHVALRRVVNSEPLVLVGLLTPDHDSPGWQAARSEVYRRMSAEGLGDADPDGPTDLVLRWLTTYLVRPGEPAEIRAAAQLLIAGLPTATASAIP